MKFKDYILRNKLKIFGAILLITFGVLFRFFRIEFLPDFPNVEPITLAALLGGAFLGGGYALIVPLVIIVITDMALGNSAILYFTWSGFAIIGFSSLILRKSKKESFLFCFKMTGLGVAASLFFYLWTNFGVWLISGMYPHNWQGLLMSYIMGLPFLKLNLMGNLIIVPVASFGLVAALKIDRFLKIYNIRPLKLIKNLK